MNINYQLYQEFSVHGKQKIDFLRKLLQRNRKVQVYLKGIKHATKLKLALLQQKIHSQKIYLERPIMKSILAYLNLMKKPPLVLKEHEIVKNFTLKDIQMINKLTTNKGKKRSIKSIKASVSKALSSHPKQIDFIQLAQMQASNYKHGLQRYRELKRQTEKNQEISPFSLNEQSLLIEKHNIYRDNWDKICNFFDGRSFQYLYYRFQYYANKDFKKGRWSLVQNIKLLILVEHFGEKKWAAISKRIKDRSQIQVRERFCNILDSSISKNSWNTEQIRLLLTQAVQQNYEWRKIVKLPLFQGKTDNILWRKFRSLMLQKTQAQIKVQVQNKKLVKSFLQIRKKRQERRRKK